MFVVNDDLSIYITRGDVAFFDVTAEDNGAKYIFQPGDVVRIKVTEKKNCENVVLQKDFPVLEAAEKVEIVLEEKDTKIGGVISKPTDYWYEIELNPFSNPQTIIGYDDEDGAKIFKLFPEGKDLTTDITEEDIPVVDDDLSLTSDRPVQNQVIARNIAELKGRIEGAEIAVAETVRFSKQVLTEGSQEQARANIGAASQGDLTTLKARVTNLAAMHENGTPDYGELADLRVGYDGTTYDSAGEAVRSQVSALGEAVSSQVSALEAADGEIRDRINKLSNNEMTSVTLGGFVRLDGETDGGQPAVRFAGTESLDPVYLKNIAYGMEAHDAAAVGQLKSILTNPQNFTEAEKEQARANIGALGHGAPRAQVRQIYCRDADGKVVNFVDVYFAANWSYRTYEGQYRHDVFGLEAHGTTSTAQRVFHSKDGGETWSEYCSLPMDAANGVYYTDFAVDYSVNCIYLLRVNDGVGNDFSVASFYLWSGDGKWHKRDTDIELGAKRWLSNNSFEICNYGATRVAMFGEYGTTTDGTAYCLWRTTNGGATWNKVLEIVGDDNTSGTMVRGEIRHWHTVKADPFTQHIWAASGDTDSQCKIYRSTDGGVNWELMFSGSQRERTCGFVFEEDCIYYGMDAKHGTDPNFTRIVKIDKSKLDTDRENCREDVAIVDSCRSVYGLTRTFYPDGFIVWTQQEPDSMFKSNNYTLQFYDYATKKLYPIAYFDISNISTSKYIGFYAGAKCQSLTSGVIFAKPTNSMHQEKYGFNFVSKHIKINLTM